MKVSIGRAVARALSFAALAALPAGGSASAATLESTKILNWTAGAYSSDSSGEFTRCSMSVAYKSGITLLFSIDRKYDWAMALINPKWQLSNGASYSIRLTVDDFEPITTNAKVLSGTMVGIQLQDNSDLFNAFRRGRLLTVAAGREDFSFRLDGTSDGLAWLLRCVKRYEGYRPSGPGSTNPFGGGSNRVEGTQPVPPAGAILNSPAFKPTVPAPAPVPARPAEPAIEARVAPAPAAPQAAPAPAPATVVAAAPAPQPVAATPSTPAPGSIEARVEATIFLASLMASASLSDYRVMPPSEAPAKQKDADVVFSTPDGMVGTVRIAAGPDARGVTNGIIAADAQACTGQYASGSVPAVGGRSDIAHVFTGCDQTGRPSSARYTVVARKKGGYYVVGLYTQGGDGPGDRMKQVDGSIREASASVVGRF